MPLYCKAVRFVIGKQNIFFVRLDCTLVSDQSLGLVTFILYYSYQRYAHTRIFEHASRSIQLAFATIDHKYSW